MKFLIITKENQEFLHWHYARHQGLENWSFQEQAQARWTSRFHIGSCFSLNLRKLGHEAHDFFVNDKIMQKTWALEHGLEVPERRCKFRLRRGIIPWVSRTTTWPEDILESQIKYYKPDVLINQTMQLFNTKFWQRQRNHIGLLIGKQAWLEHMVLRNSAIISKKKLGVYDLIISSFPPTIDYVRQEGIPADLHRLGFEPEVLPYLEERGAKYDVSFIGNFVKGIHDSRIKWLETIVAINPQLKIWSSRADDLPADSPLIKCYMGPAWGRDYFQILHDSKITLNEHGNVPPYANNLRLFEATGAGAMLITDWKSNLEDMFEPGREVVTYRDPEECANLIRYYLEHDDKRQIIARAGQQRTLKEHTYYNRMRELLDILHRYL
jgi:spore maturation protein CgeB